METNRIFLYMLKSNNQKYFFTAKIQDGRQWSKIYQNPRCLLFILKKYIHPEKIFIIQFLVQKILAQRFCHFEFWLQFWLHFYFSTRILSHPSTINAESLPTLFWLPGDTQQFLAKKLGQKCQNGQFLAKSTLISGNTALTSATSGSCIRCYQNIHLAPNFWEFWHFLKIFG